MNHENESWPASARRAFDDYPKIAASPDFNARVLAALEERSAARQTTLLGRLEAFLGLPLGQFIGSGALGAFLPMLVLGALYFSNGGPPPPVAPVPVAPQFLRAYGPLYARELWALHPDSL